MGSSARTSARCSDHGSFGRVRIAYWGTRTLRNAMLMTGLRQFLSLQIDAAAFEGGACDHAAMLAIAFLRSRRSFR